MLLILTIVRFTVFGLVKRWFKSWVAVDLMDVLNHFQQYFTHVVVRAYWRVQSKNLWLHAASHWQTWWHKVVYRIHVPTCVNQTRNSSGDLHWLLRQIVNLTNLRSSPRKLLLMIGKSTKEHNIKYMSTFLAHLAKGNVSFWRPSSVVR